MTKQEQADKQKNFEFQTQAMPLLPMMYANARRLCGPQYRDYVDDLVDETYIKAFRSWHTFKQGTELAAWMKVIMKNTLTNHKIKVSKESVFTSYDALEDWQQEQITESLTSRTSRSAEAEAIDAMSQNVVEAALDKVSPEYREVLDYVLIRGYSYAETAKELGVKQNTVGTRLGRGKDQLREILKSYAVQEGYSTKVIKKQRKSKASGVEK
ncbi:MAG: RNA polymerase sigma factor [Micrococcales bacterium]